MAAPAPRQGALGRGARPRILAAARQLFADPGINATGVAQLCAAARVSRRTLYQHFPSKDDVVVAWLRECEENPGDEPEAVLERDDLAPRAQLLELFSALGDGPRPLRGSPFAAAAVELADPGHPGHRFAAAHTARLAGRLADLARDAGARDADAVGVQLALLYDGAAIQTVLLDDLEPSETARSMAAAILADAID